jgi:uncharacterized protein with von Willebrand factor type A (vWA) domain
MHASMSSSPDLVARLVAFGRALRDDGLGVGTGALVDFARAAALLPPGDLYWAGRATLAPGPTEIERYDRVFRAFFGGAPPPRAAAPPRSPLGAGGAPGAGGRGGETATGTAFLASQVEVLRHTSFGALSEEELARLPELVAQLRLTPPLRRSRRRRAARAGELDLRRTLRRSFRTGGEPIERRFRARTRKPRRVVLVLDVSRSMAPYSRALLLFAHAAMRADARWEAFCFGTRLTRLSGALRDADPGRAVALAAESAVDRDGGTRIGESLAQLLARREHVAVLRGAVVVVCSDGLERGDPELLRRQMARLARVAARIVWLNPLKEDSRYEPLARGMRAALPFVDVFASGHDLASLQALARELPGLRA